jgi:hypothetical protein
MVWNIKTLLNEQDVGKDDTDCKESNTSNFWRRRFLCDMPQSCIKLTTSGFEKLGGIHTHTDSMGISKAFFVQSKESMIKAYQYYKKTLLYSN